MNNDSKIKKMKGALALVLSAVVLGTPVISHVLGKTNSKTTKPSEIVQMDDAIEKKWHITDAFVYEVTYRGGQKAIMYFKDGHIVDLYDIKDPELNDIGVDMVPLWINCGDLFSNLFGWSKSDIESTTLSEGTLAKLAIDGMYAWGMTGPDYDPVITYEDSNFMSDELYEHLFQTYARPYIENSTSGPGL